MQRRLLSQRPTLEQYTPGTDSYGADAHAWVDAGCFHAWLSQSTRDEVHAPQAGTPTGSRSADVAVWHCYTDDRTVLGARDRVRWSGMLFEVEASSRPCYRGSRIDHHETTLRRVEG